MNPENDSFTRAYREYVEHERATLRKKHPITDEFRLKLWDRIHAAQEAKAIPQGPFVFDCVRRLIALLAADMRGLAYVSVVIAASLGAVVLFANQDAGKLKGSFRQPGARGETPGESEVLKALAPATLSVQADFRTATFSIELSDGSSLKGSLLANPKLNLFNEPGKEFFEVSDLRGENKSGIQISGHAALQLRRTDANTPLRRFRMSDLRYAKFRLELSCGDEDEFTAEYEIFPTAR